MFFPQAFMASLTNLKTLFAGYLINKAHTDHIIKLTTPEVCAPIPSPCSVSHPRHLWFSNVLYNLVIYYLSPTRSLKRGAISVCILHICNPNAYNNT